MIPLLLQPIYKSRIWGGDKLRTVYGRGVQADGIGESWDVACRGDDTNIILNGTRKGETLRTFIESDRLGVLGARSADCGEFPLLFKIIDAAEDLSIQVHPNDEYARKTEHAPYGKTETWYVMDAPKGAELILGIAEGVTREKLEHALRNGNGSGLRVTDCFSRLPVAAGDVVHVPAGTPHAVTGGITLMEIQQNSDVTYRIYDYNRIGADGLPRELHISKALDVIDFERGHDGSGAKAVHSKECGFTVARAVTNRFYAIDIVSTTEAGVMEQFADGETFAVLSCVEGVISVCGGGETVTLKAGSSTFIPAALGKYAVAAYGAAKFLRNYVPDNG